MIPNHFSPRLSDLDLRMVCAVPPGGNWKDIPLSVPSRRLEQIRSSYAAGEGSRSTYYGRLHPNAPAYTVSTYIGRPGNGCFIHYDAEGGQHRMISQREAARLQSFPDRFHFFGSRTAVNTQIGNAVPPLLAYQLALSLRSSPAAYLDLFAGAGGLSLGFKWAGWTPVVATDIDAAALTSYSENIHQNIIIGDIRDRSLFDQLVARVEDRPRTQPLWVVGGPPCQGFSTAGNARSLSDDRNHLFEPYRDALLALEPEGFVFENVPGLLNMHGGRVIRMIRSELESAGYRTEVWDIRAEEFAVPQRRRRVVIVGTKPGAAPLRPPSPVTSMSSSQLAIVPVAPAYTVSEVLADLPRLDPGEDGSELDYASDPQNSYQRFARGIIGAGELVAAVRGGRR